MKRATFVLLMAMATEVAVAQSASVPQTMTVCTETMQQTRGLFRIPTRDRNKQCQTTTVSGNMLGFGGGLGMAPVGAYTPRCPECVTSQTIAYIRDAQVRSEDSAAARIAELEAELARERARTTQAPTTTPRVSRAAIAAPATAQATVETRETEEERRRLAIEALRVYGSQP